MNPYTVDHLLKSWPGHDRAWAEEVIAEHARHERECPCTGTIEGHKRGWPQRGPTPANLIKDRSWFDHLSHSRTEDGRIVFMSQPYFNTFDLSDFAADMKTLRAAGWTVIASLNSTHYPGATISVTMTPPVKVKT
jgi:hypothetical protein